MSASSRSAAGSRWLHTTGEPIMAEQKLQGHGEVGRREQGFTRLLGPRQEKFDEARLLALAEAMIVDGDDEIADGRDPEENLLVPAGYTYLSQFVDHDLTFETTSSLDL